MGYVGNVGSPTYQCCQYDPSQVTITSVSSHINICANDIPDDGDETLNNEFTLIEINKLINKLKNNE